MKYVANLTLNSTQIAFSFDNHKDAENYVKSCSAQSSSNPNEVIINNTPVKVLISEHADNKILFVVLYRKNVEDTMGFYFMTRQSAIDFAHKVLARSNRSAKTCEDDFGQWIIDKPKEKIYLSLRLLIIKDNETIKSPSRADTRLLEAPFCIDMRPFLHDFETFSELADMGQKAAMSPFYAKVRTTAKILIITGIIQLLLVGGYIIATQRINYITIGLILIALFALIRGIYRLINPLKAILKIE